MRYKFISNQSEDYITLICQDKILICPAWTDLTLRLHREIKFHSRISSLFCTLYLIRFAYIFKKFSFVSMCQITF